MKSIYIFLITLLISTSFYSCETSKIEGINIGYIGPLSVRATDLGIDPSKAMQLAVEQYNESRLTNEPKVNLFIEDDKWERDNAIAAYKNLRDKHNIDVLFISNTDGTVAVQDKIIEDKVILINPLNNDKLLSSLNKNTFNIAKSTEEANGLVAIRLIELGYKKVALFQYPNDFMTRGANEVKRLLEDYNLRLNIITTDKEQVDFTNQLKALKEDNYDAYVFFGYKEFGFAMKQARELGITAPFYGSTVLLDPEFYTNSEGAIVDTEYPFFTISDGNYILANEFLTAFKNKFGKNPTSIWPPMQAYDAMNLVLTQLRNINKDKEKDQLFDDWLRTSLYRVHYFQGICGNIAITNEGASKGIYFSLYKYESKENPTVKVKR
ncbi:ABC transporter substrate-binding protein [Hwangdonia sp.]|uniref:ABC transporter substrate-binding protein n=1 Tax=Hwangdonia sp. TaxID=1883432 RepID=UPI003AB678ED